MVEGEKIVFRLSKSLWNECKDSKVKDLQKLEAKQLEYSRHMKIIEQSVASGPVICSECGLSRNCSSCTTSYGEMDDVVPSSSPQTRLLKKRRISEDDKLNPSNFLDFLVNLRSNLPPDVMSCSVESDEIECYVGAPSTLSNEDMLNHLISVRVEYVQRIMRPVLHKLMSHQKNGDAFNNPVDYLSLGLLDYPMKIKQPMDLGTVKCNLLKGKYHSIKECSDDIILVFKNALSYNPPSHVVHQCAVLLYAEFKEDLRILKEKVQKDGERKSQHSCSVCLGSCCILCGDRCLKYEPAIMVCHGTCGQKIKRNSTYYVAIDGGMVWCQKCYTGIGPVMADGYGPEHKPLLKRELIRRKFDEESLEPWIQCRTCSRRVHQVCALYNPLQDDSVLGDIGVGRKLPSAFFECPVCKVEKISKSVDLAIPQTRQKRDSTESTVIKRLRQNSHFSRGDRIRVREERKAESSVPLKSGLKAISNHTEREVRLITSDDLEPSRVKNESAEGLVESAVTFHKEFYDASSHQIASQQTGASDTSHEAETVFEDIGSEDEGEDLDNKSALESILDTRYHMSTCHMSDFGNVDGSSATKLHQKDRWKASSLPKSRLSDFISAMVADKLANLGNEDLMDTLTIRMVSNCMHNFEVPDVIRNNLPTVAGNRVEQYMMFKQKCILLFQKIDGVDVCLFCLYVQEFDERCPEPNKSKVYIAYLDSVEYFRPRSLRTIVYHEILVAYLKWSQARGFKQGHIWACPPQRGDNFIFWCHPPQQRTPSRDRLNGWYNTMLARASALGILNSVDTLWDKYFSTYGKRDESAVRAASKNSFVAKNSQAIAARRGMAASADLAHQHSSHMSPVCPPVFEGDYWVNECIRVYKLVHLRIKGLDGQDCHVNQRRCREILKIMMSKPIAAAFNQPVDPVLLNIPDYTQIISTPMDLSTIRERLRLSYYRSMIDFANDIRLTFNNAMTYNPLGHPVHVFASKLLEDFESQMADLVTERIGAMLAGSASTDYWLGTYPLNSGINGESQERKGEGDDGSAIWQHVLQGEPEASPKASETYGMSEETEMDSGDPDIVPFCDNIDGFDESDRYRRDCENSLDTNFGEPQNCLSTVEESVDGNDDSMSVHSNQSASKQSDLLLTRQDSTESCLSVIDQWPCRTDTIRSHVCSAEDSASIEMHRVFPLVETPFEKSQLGQKGVMALMSELCRHVCRLKEDMYVITFASGENKAVATGGSREVDHDVESLVSCKSQIHGKGKALHRYGVKIGQGTGVPDVGEISDHCKAMLAEVCPDTSDPDEIRRCHFVDSRQTFLELSQYRHFQFDTLRRAKHSSMMILFHLLHPKSKYIRPVCSECDNPITEVRWHCNQCIAGDYDICGVCLSSPSFCHDHVELTPVRVPLI